MIKRLLGLSTTALIIAVWSGLCPKSIANPGHAHGPAHSASPGQPHHEQGHGAGHAHREIEVPTDQPIPTVKLYIYPDAIAGWNLQVETLHWAFAPTQVNQSSVTHEGHAHLYLDGEKLTRLYGPWYYLPSLPPGEHTLMVTLNANGHEVLVHNGQPIADSITISVPTP